MTDRQCSFRCAYCSRETKIILSGVSASVRSSTSKKIQIIRYCEYCNRSNILNVPELWDVNALVLGDEVIGYSEGVPVIQGQKLL